MKRMREARALMVLAVVALGTFGIGCSKKLVVNPIFTMPEGVQSSNAMLVMYPDLGNLITAKHQDVGGVFNITDSTFTIYGVGPGAAQGVIFDGTPATAYQIFRRASNGGYNQLKDFSLTSQRKWFDTQWEAYTFTDISPSGYSPPTYVGRGTLTGIGTASSPLTNPASLPAALSNVIYTGPASPPDSLFDITWNAVAGAQGYWLEVFNFRGDLRTAGEKYPLGSAAPVAVGKVHDYFVGYVAAPATTFKLGGPGATVLHYESMLRHQQYRVRVSAVDGSGSLLGCTVGVPDTVFSGTEAFIFSVRSVVVEPR